MGKVLALAKKGMGYVSPNPLVGCIVTKGDEIILSGYHKKFGDYHAERIVLQNADLSLTSGADLYVNLEPCNHQGKTPPCSDIIIEKKIKRVFVGSSDPNPLVSGKGVQKLRDAGIEVITGIRENECNYLNRFFFKYISNNKSPFITIKIAQTIDGYIALENGDSKWISCERSRKLSHKMRLEHDAILVGKNTVLNDNPHLTLRSIKGRNPRRIILDTHLSLPLDKNIFQNNGRNDNIIVCSEKGYDKSKEELFNQLGYNVCVVPTDSNNKIDLELLFNKLGKEYNISSILVEGGAEVITNIIKSDLIDELHVFYSPIIFGNGKKAFNELGIKSIASATRLKINKYDKIENDIYAIYTKEKK